jgi:hypothetical protein
MASIQAAYHPLEQAAAAFTAAAGEVDVLLAMVDGPARTDSGDATVNAGIVHIAQDLRGGLAWAATTLRAERASACAAPASPTTPPTAR